MYIQLRLSAVANKSKSMKISIKYASVTTVIIAASLLISQRSVVQASAPITNTRAAACPQGFVCEPITVVPNCPVGYTCTPITSTNPTQQLPVKLVDGTTYDGAGNVFVRLSIAGYTTNTQIDHWVLTYTCSSGVVLDTGKSKLCDGFAAGKSSQTYYRSNMFDSTTDYLMLTADAGNTSSAVSQIYFNLEARDPSDRTIGVADQRVIRVVPRVSETSVCPTGYTCTQITTTNPTINDVSNRLYYYGGQSCPSGQVATGSTCMDYQAKRNIVKNLYNTIQCRDPEAQGWEYWTNWEGDMSNITEAMKNGSIEYPTKQQIIQIFMQKLGRAPSCTVVNGTSELNDWYGIAYGANTSSPNLSLVIPGTVPVPSRDTTNPNVISIPVTTTVNAANTSISENVTCVFSGSSLQQSCTSGRSSGTENLYSCSGSNTCTTNVTATNGTKLTWRSSCGGIAQTTVDGAGESVSFSCNSIAIPAPVSEQTTTTLIPAHIQIRKEPTTTTSSVDTVNAAVMKAVKDYNSSLAL